MINVQQVEKKEEATHIYVLKQCSGIVEGITGGQFYPLNKDGSVTDSDGERNIAWNMTDYCFVRVVETL